MRRLKRIISENRTLTALLLLFLGVHLFLMNVNFAEWGDSYRILRASEYIRDFSYPDDEKRPPLFSFILALRPFFADQVNWGRFVMFALSTLSLYFFYKLIKIYGLNERQRNLALLMFILNPVYLYWSLRIMADVPFTLLVLITFYLLAKWDNVITLKRGILLGIILGLSVLTRFEGYILGFSVVLGLLILAIKQKDIASVFKRYTYIGAGSLLTLGPWFLYRNPLTSSYFEEPQNRAYDLNMLLIYIFSLLFVMGFVFSLFFMVKKLSWRDIYKVQPPIAIFLLVELVLALAWPAAIPRLLTPIIPFLSILISVCAVEYFSESSKNYVKDGLILSIILILYVVAQYFLKLQFLVLIKPLFVITVLIQAGLAWFILQKKYKAFLLSLFVSLLVWSFSTIYLHKDIFKPVVMANKYISENLSGTIAYNDVSSISDWYLNQSSQKDSVEGKYLNLDTKEGRAYKNIEASEADYVLITNEHNTDMEFNSDELKYLEEIKEFRYTIRGKEFFTKILKFVK